MASYTSINDVTVFNLDSENNIKALKKYLLTRTELWSQLNKLKQNDLESLDELNKIFISLERSYLILNNLFKDHFQHNYLNYLTESSANKFMDVESKLVRINDKLSALKIFTKNLKDLNSIISGEFKSSGTYRISQDEIREIFGHELLTEDEINAIFKKARIVDHNNNNNNNIYEFRMIDFSKNLDDLNNLLNEQKIKCENLKLKIITDKENWIQLSGKLNKAIDLLQQEK
ncbi:hypothetical protein PACTADRAFT_50525 [Pachysolen tannophilus NRRL Y-2460]|uniref:Uncharacterized protein n=1 Tax=Pachysolen tannophilus NRRL Y-2460 TaxID=669874 RepID=A0A1E4TSF9_PACTA|nr:hypothetical protein PACTADRAFT_50525 [Pachysolen tannophilus NRRL Y-2460]